AVGTVVAGRERAELEDLIGFFVNTLALRADLAGDPPFGELLARVRAVSLAAFAHAELPFEKLVEELNPERSLARSPIFQVMCVLQNAPGGELHVPGLGVGPLALGAGAAKFELTLSAFEAPDGLAASLEHRTELWDGPTLRRLLGHLATLLAAAADDPGRRLSELPLM